LAVEIEESKGGRRIRTGKRIEGGTRWKTEKTDGRPNSIQTSGNGQGKEKFKDQTETSRRNNNNKKKEKKMVFRQLPIQKKAPGGKKEKKGRKGRKQQKHQ